MPMNFAKIVRLLAVMSLSATLYSNAFATDFQHKHEIVVDRVIDGDTVDVDIYLGFGIWLRGERIRVLGLDAPESRTSDPIEKAFGNLSTEKMREYLAQEGVMLVLESYDTGKYGGTLGTFLLPNGKTVTQVMIDNHYGVAYHGQNKDDVEEDHLENREILIEQGEVSLP